MCFPEGGNLLYVIEDTASEACAYTSKTYRLSGTTIVDICTVEAASGHLLVLTADGSLHVLNLPGQTSTQLCAVDLPDIPLDDDGGHFGAPSYRLHASPDGAYVAVVIDRGRNGIVVETQTGATTMQLDGGDYYEETVPFSACFLRLDGNDVFVHRTAWNRLEASDPATGKCLTHRYIAPYESGGERPAHYLDYFHGQLLPSPGGERMFDDGWVWHPVSIPRVWSVVTWLKSNPWESEDGASIVDLGMRDDWTQPACWIDEQRIAIGGAGVCDDEASEETKCIPGVRILDVNEAGPVMDSQWPLLNVENATALFSDGKCLYVAAATGTTVWDISSREQLADYPGFVARLLDRTRNTLLAFGREEIQEIALGDLASAI